MIRQKSSFSRTINSSKYTGFDEHLILHECEDEQRATQKTSFRSLSQLKIDEKYGRKPKKAFIGWCSIFILTESGHLVNIGYLVSNKNSAHKETKLIECKLDNSWDLKHLDCGPKETYAVLSDQLLRK